MNVSILGYEFYIDYWSATATIYFISLLIIIQSIMIYPPWKSGSRHEVDGWTVASILLFCPAVVALGFPFFILFVSGSLIFNGRDAIDAFWSFIDMEVEWFNRYCDTDYIAIFMPVACVLTLFLLD